MIQAVILNFEQVSYDEYKTIPYIKEFSEKQSIIDIEKWVKTIDPAKNISHVYFAKDINILKNNEYNDKV